MHKNLYFYAYFYKKLSKDNKKDKFQTKLYLSNPLF